MNTHTVEQSITSQLLDAILNSSTPEHRYREIYKIHATYAAQNVSIVYPEPTNGGIIDIAMIGQQGYGAIKLSERTNFNGWTFRVTTSTILEWKHLNGISLSPSEINNKVFAISNKSVTANQLYHAFIEGVNVPYTNTINNHV